MGKKLSYTPNSQIRSALRQLWLRSRERRAAIVRTGNKCENCHVKASKARGREVVIDVHHMRAPNWDRIFKVIRDELLVDPDELKPMCEVCHDAHHSHGEAQG